MRSLGSSGAQAGRGSSRPSRHVFLRCPLTQVLLAADIEVGEVRPPTRSSRALTGKSDPIDAEAAARSVLGRPRDQVMEPHAAGTRAAIRILLASRSLLDHQRTANRNALTALLRGTDLGIDARSSLRDAQITTIAAWRTSNSTGPVIRIARAEAKRLALAVKDLTARLAENHKALGQLTEELAPGLQSGRGATPPSAQGLRRHRPHPDDLRHRNRGLRDAQPGNREIKPGDPPEPQTLRLPLHLPPAPNHGGLTEPVEESVWVDVPGPYSPETPSPG